MADWQDLPRIVTWFDNIRAHPAFKPTYLSRLAAVRALPAFAGEDRCERVRAARAMLTAARNDIADPCRGRHAAWAICCGATGCRSPCASEFDDKPIKPVRFFG